MSRPNQTTRTGTFRAGVRNPSLFNHHRIAPWARKPQDRQPERPLTGSNSAEGGRGHSGLVFEILLLLSNTGLSPGLTSAKTVECAGNTGRFSEAPQWTNKGGRGHSGLVFEILLLLRQHRIIPWARKPQDRQPERPLTRPSSAGARRLPVTPPRNKFLFNSFNHLRIPLSPTPPKSFAPVR